MRQALGSVRSAIYARVSTTKQEDEGTSLESQERECRKYAATKGYAVVAAFRETYSGADLFRRPALSAMREAIKRGDLDVLIVYSLDRLTRDVAHLYFLKTEAEAAGVSIELVTEALDSTPEGKLLQGVYGFLGEVERLKIIERTQRGVRSRAESGKLLARSKPPFGYRWRDSTRDALDVDEEAASLVRRIFRQVASGVSMNRVAQSLNDAGIPTPKHGGYGWTTTTVRHIITNPAYKGEAWAYRWQAAKAKTGGRRNIERPQSQWIALPEGTIPALVSETEWEAANALRAGNKNGSIRNSRNHKSFLLRAGFARCGYCDQALIGRARPNANPFYCCTRHDCHHHSITASTLDAAVWEGVVRVLGDPDFVRQYIEQDAADDPTEQELTEIEQALAEVVRQQHNLTKRIAAIDDEETAVPLMEELRALGARKRRLQDERGEALARRVANEQAIAQIEGMFKWYEVGHDRIEAMSYEEKRAWMTQLGVKARVWRSGHEPRYEIEMNVDPSFWEPWDDREDASTLDGAVWHAADGTTYQGAEVWSFILSRAARRTPAERRSRRPRSRRPG